MPPGRASWVRPVAALMLAAVAALAVFGTRTGLAWIGRPFPGFFVLRNRVVASVSLPGWPAAMAPEIFQATVVAIDDVPIGSSRELYDRVRARPERTRFGYTLERDGVRTIES